MRSPCLHSGSISWQRSHEGKFRSQLWVQEKSNWRCVWATEEGLWPWIHRSKKECRKEERTDEKGRGGLTQIESRNCPQQEKGQEQAASHVPAVL